ncbi:MAG: 23S rRNA (pseudouridine(1915)-N(3))-methyltransferase RlmH [Rhizobiaceae bacterium]
MQLIIATIGRLKKGPEQELVARYVDRLAKSGKAIGISQIKTIEIVESRAASASARKIDEAQSLISRLPDKCPIFAFDERGKSPTSRQFAKLVSQQLDSGSQALALIIGGPDGLDSSLTDRADNLISFGAATFPHQLVRVLVLEQAYRAVTILTNHPYHRD